MNIGNSNGNSTYIWPNEQCKLPHVKTFNYKFVGTSAIQPAIPSCLFSSLKPGNICRPLTLNQHHHHITHTITENIPYVSLIHTSCMESWEKHEKFQLSPSSDGPDLPLWWHSGGRVLAWLSVWQIYLSSSTSTSKHSACGLVHAATAGTSFRNTYILSRYGFLL